jgi:hypothetical protein
MSDDWDVIFSYTRREAIADGVLVDVTETAREAGFRYPVALTAAVHGKCVQVPPGAEAQDERGRLWDVLWMLRVATLKAGSGNSTIHYEVLVRNDDVAPRLVELKAVCGPDDDAAPCITVMFPDED